MRFVAYGAAMTAALIGVAAFATSTRAAGLSHVHAQVQIGNRICMADHHHYGQSGAWFTKEQAASVAAQSWGGITGLEYGDDWADFRLANNQQMKCDPIQSDRGLMWQCNAKASPCRLLGGSDVAVIAAPAMAPHRQVQAHAHDQPEAVAARRGAHPAAPAVAMEVRPSRRIHTGYRRYGAADHAAPHGASMQAPVIAGHRHTHYCGHIYHRVRAAYYGHGERRALVWPGDAR